MNDLTISENSSFAAMRDAKDRAGGHLTQVEQSRAITEVQAALTIAKHSPRDELDAHTSAMKTCARASFAEKAIYKYKRGTETIEGPSIKMAEALARCYGNLEHGWRELERFDDKSVVESFCWDLENNVKSKVTFEVPHYRETKQGKYRLKTDRDLREHLANFASRQKRGCILSCIPADIVEDATNACKAAMRNEISSNKVDHARKLVLAFDEIGVTHDMLRQYLKVEKVVGASEAQLVDLRQIYAAIKDGQSSVNEFFGRVEEPAYLQSSILQVKKDALIQALRDKGPNFVLKCGEGYFQKVELAKTVEAIDKLNDVYTEVLVDEQKRNNESVK
jgi:hypothetical protein